MDTDDTILFISVENQREEKSKREIFTKICYRWDKKKSVCLCVQNMFLLLLFLLYIFDSVNWNALVNSQWTKLNGRWSTSEQKSNVFYRFNSSSEGNVKCFELLYNCCWNWDIKMNIIWRKYQNNMEFLFSCAIPIFITEFYFCPHISSIRYVILNHLFAREKNQHQTNNKTGFLSLFQHVCAFLILK